MREQGIQIRLNTTVSGIDVEDDVTGVRTEDGQHVAADAVISNADPVHLYSKMLPASSVKPARLKARHHKQSMGLFVLFFGTDRQYSDIAHHTI